MTLGQLSEREDGHGIPQFEGSDCRCRQRRCDLRLQLREPAALRRSCSRGREQGQGLGRGARYPAFRLLHEPQHACEGRRLLRVQGCRCRGDLCICTDAEGLPRPPRDAEAVHGPHEGHRVLDHGGRLPWHPDRRLEPCRCYDLLRLEALGACLQTRSSAPARTSIRHASARHSPACTISTPGMSRPM
jgi:hypothetical protein